MTGIGALAPAGGRAAGRTVASLEARRESELVRRARGGEVAAFEALYRLNAGRVHALCLRMTGDVAVAEELTQDAFVRAWKKLASFRGDSAFASWLYRLTVNLVLGYRRGTSRRRARLEERPEELPEAPSYGGAGSGSRLDLERAVRRLPRQARLIFVLHDIEGHTHREIAALTGLAEGTSKAHLHRARKLLRETLR